MSNTMHTPGPWEIDRPLEGQTCITVKDHPSNAQPIVCRIFNSSHIYLSEQYFNAHLIASAPELLAELEKSANVIAHCISEMPAAYREAMRSQLATAREVIAKATAA